MLRDEVREITNGGSIIIPILLLEKLEKEMTQLAQGCKESH